MIFLSYSWKDQTAAHRIDALLRANGFNVWIDFRQLDSRADITEQLDLAIRDCSMFLAVRPSSCKRSPWMATEFLLARKYCKPIVHCAVGLDEPTTPEQALTPLVSNQRAIVEALREITTALYSEAASRRPPLASYWSSRRIPPQLCADGDPEWRPGCDAECSPQCGGA
jgi:hypothetical protein